jgi:phosphoribosylglycinamide formyltransferase 1
LLRLAVLISGGGSNLQSIIDSIKNNELQCSIEYVISDRAAAFGLERAWANGIKCCILDRKEFGSELSDTILKRVEGKVDLIVMAGFLSILKGELLKMYKNKIINIHPSLLPCFCGNGMYGIKVHKNVIASGVKLSGCSVHFVDEGTDSGPIILQKAVPVYFEDTPETLQERILIEEHKLLPQAIQLISQDKVQVVGSKVKIRGV